MTIISTLRSLYYTTPKNLPRKILLSLSLGTTITTLLSNDFKNYHMDPHSGNPNAKQTFNKKFNPILSKHNWKPIIYTMIATNLIICLCWRQFPEFMSKHFIANIENFTSKRYHTLLTSSWSHIDLWHVGLNMYVLHNFGGLMIETIGIPNFLIMYLSAGITGSSLSLLLHSLLKTTQYSSLGASASIISIITAFAIYQPDAQFKIVFTPDDLSFNAKYGLFGLILFDTVGLLMRWKFLDHAAHLGGALTGFISWNIFCKLYGNNNENILLSDEIKKIENIEKINKNNINNLLCVRGKWIYQGKYEKYRNCDNKGIIYAPTKTYCGEMNKNGFIFNGKGCLRNEINGSVFYGEWENGSSKGVGLLVFDDGTYTPAIYDSNIKDFVIPEKFDLNDLKFLFENNNIDKSFVLT